MKALMTDATLAHYFNCGDLDCAECAAVCQAYWADEEMQAWWKHAGPAWIARERPIAVDHTRERRRIRTAARNTKRGGLARALSVRGEKP